MAKDDENDNVVPIRRSGPDDSEVSLYLTQLWMVDSEELDKLMAELKEARQHNTDQGWPENFAYGQLLNKLRALLKEDVVHMLAAAMWGSQTDE